MIEQYLLLFDSMTHSSTDLSEDEFNRLDNERQRVLANIEARKGLIAKARSAVAAASEGPASQERDDRLARLTQRRDLLIEEMGQWQRRLLGLEATLAPARAAAGAHPPITCEAEFRALMEVVDADLSARGVPIPARQLEASAEVARRMRMGILGGPLSDGPPDPDDYASASLSKRIRDWTQARYGDKLKVDFSIGATVVMVRGDVWLVSVPLIYGSMRIVFDRDFTVSYAQTSGPALPGVVATMNALKLVRDLAAGLAATLTDIEVSDVAASFMPAIKVFQEMEAIGRSRPLAESARVDLRKAAEICADDKNSQGLSRWHSLQAVEKMMKVLLEARSGVFPHTHSLKELNALTKHKANFELSDLEIAAIQCAASVRYEPEKSSVTQAIAAQQTAVRAIQRIVGAIQTP